MNKLTHREGNKDFEILLIDLQDINKSTIDKISKLNHLEGIDNIIKQNLKIRKILKSISDIDNTELKEEIKRFRLINKQLNRAIILNYLIGLGYISDVIGFSPNIKLMIISAIVSITKGAYKFHYNKKEKDIKKGGNITYYDEGLEVAELGIDIFGPLLNNIIPSGAKSVGIGLTLINLGMNAYDDKELTKSAEENLGALEESIEKIRKILEQEKNIS